MSTRVRRRGGDVGRRAAAGPDARDVLLIMAKMPEPGAVKTRLAAAVGAEPACTLYRAFLADLAERFGHGPWRTVWAVAPAGADLGSIVGPCEQIAQQGPTLGARMADAFAQCFTAGARRVLMLGADAPHLSAAQVVQAFVALEETDAVFVPTRDGGYCAVGLRAVVDVFSAVPMGGPDVFDRTCRALRAHGLGWRALASTFDVDQLEDARALLELLDAGTGQLPHTTLVLRAWKAAGRL